MVGGSVAVEGQDESGTQNHMAQAQLLGCLPHALIFMARFLANTLDYNAINYFLQLLQAEVTNRQLREAEQLQKGTAAVPPPTEKPATPQTIAEQDLLNMPLPTEARRWKQ